jgi:hypothetical protein
MLTPVFVKKSLLQPEKMIDINIPDPGKKDIHSLPGSNLQHIQGSLIRIQHLDPSLKIDQVIHGINQGGPDHDLIPSSIVEQMFIIDMKQEPKMIAHRILKEKISPDHLIGFILRLGLNGPALHSWQES